MAATTSGESIPVQMGDSFIAAAEPRGREGDPATYLRRDFDVSDVPARAKLRITAVGVIEPHLNGAVVGDEVLVPGWTSYHNRLIVSTFDVTGRIVVGTNTIGAVLGQGWAVGRLGWEDKRNHYAQQPAALVALELEFRDGSTRTIGSDAEFRSATGGLGAHSLYDGEEFDARLEPLGWDAPGFDDSAWDGVVTTPWPTQRLEHPIAEPIRRIEEIRPTSVMTTPSGRTVVDFGQNFSGWTKIRPRGAAGDRIVLRHAEVMTDGELDPVTLRTARATDSYTLRGGATEEWEPRFTFHGFRYVEIEGWPGELSDGDIVAVVVHSDMTRTGSLETSDPLLNRLHDNAVWSMRGNFVGVPTDCPQRDERLGWTGDINAFAPSAAFLYDVRNVLGSWLRDLAVEYSIAGNVPWVVPDVMPNPSSPTALWSDVVVNLPWVLYEEYGDEQILRDAYDAASRFVRQVETQLDEHGLWSTGFQFGDWLDPDAPNDNPSGGKTDRHLVASAYLCRTTHQLAQMARILGRDDDASHFVELAARVRRAFRDEYVTPRGRIAGETATAYASAICFDILDGDELAHAGDRLAAIVAAAGFRISTGFAGTPLVTDALSLTGHLDEAYLLLTERGCPSFLYPVEMGATTIWERWDSIRPDGTLNPSGMTSLNHYALGAVVDWMHRTIGGIEPLEPGYRRTRIAPRPGGGLTSSRVRHDTVHGLIDVAWRVDDGQMQFDVTIPSGITADVVPPQHPDEIAVSVDEGVHSWSYTIADDGADVELSMDSTLRAVASDPAVWQRAQAVFAKHLPGIPIEGNAPESATITLNALLGYIPGVPDGLEDDLRAALSPR